MTDLHFAVTLQKDDYPHVSPDATWFAFNQWDDRLITWQHTAGHIQGGWKFEIVADWGVCLGRLTKVIENETGVLTIPRSMLAHPGSINWTIWVHGKEYGSFDKGFDDGFIIMSKPDGYLEKSPSHTIETGKACTPYSGRFDIPRIPILPYG